MRKETRNWLAQAREDREAAQVLFNSRKFFGVAFYSHQAVEKALKGAILEMTRSLPPKTHNLNELGRTLRVSEDIAEHPSLPQPGLYDISLSRRGERYSRREL